MLNFDDKKLVFKVKGEEHEMDYPTVKHIQAYRKAVEKENKDQVDATIDFLCQLGAKRDVIEELRISQLMALVEEVSSELGSKKN